MQQSQLGVERCEHLRLIVALQHLTRMPVKGYDHALLSMGMRPLHHLINKVTVSEMHPIKKADGCNNARRQTLVHNRRACIHRSRRTVRQVLYAAL